MRRRVSVALAALALAIGATWISTRATGDTALAVSGPIAERVVGRGVVDTKNGVAKVRSLIDGRALRVLVQVGDEVDAGQLLAEIESDTMASEVARREAEKRAAAAGVSSVTEGLRPEERAALEAQARAARAEWEYAEKRADEDGRLFATGGLSASARDATLETARVKRALMEESESRLRQAQAGGRPADVAAARERTQAADAALRLAQQILDRARLVAPIRGRVLVRRVDPGDTILNLPNALPLFEIGDTAQTEARIEVEELDASRLALGLAVEVALPGGGPAIARGHIARLSPRLERRTIDVDDARVRAEGLVRVAWLAWDGPDAPGLVLGQHLDAFVELGSRQAATLVPRAAVAVRDGKATVRVPHGLWSSEAVVELGIGDDHNVEVRGLDAGTRVLLH